MAGGKADVGDSDATIRRLDEQTIQRIAAGEVVERPASVVKELVENSVDADATRITIDVEGEDATDRIVVEDDGDGIDPEALAVAIEPHTTSKITDHVDLDTGPSSLGFRGEALHAIGQVSRLSIASRPPQADAGREIVVDGGEVVDDRPAGIPIGTRVTIDGLFDPVPARKKFLDSPATERSAVRRVAGDLALSHPGIAITLTIDGRERFATPGDGDRRAAIGAVYGRAVAEAMLPVESPDSLPQGVDAITGMISEPETARSATAVVTSSINGRPVRSTPLRRAIVDAYGDRLAPNRYPFAILAIDLDPAIADVNVHPRKYEVKFDDPTPVLEAVEAAVSSALREATVVPSGPPRAGGSTPKRNRGPRPAIDIGAVSTGGEQARLPGVGVTEADEPFERLPSLRVVGQANDAYIVGATGDGIVLIDQHAADERINYEQLREEVRASDQRQRLARPIPIDLTNEERDVLAAHREAIETIGFTIDERTDGSTAVSAVPAVLGRTLPPAAVEEALHRLFDGVLHRDSGETVLELADPMLADLACHPAITANEPLTMGRIESLLQQLDACNSPWTCPHGRPTMIELTGDELADRFERDYPGARPCRDWDDT